MYASYKLLQTAVIAKKRAILTVEFIVCHSE